MYGIIIIITVISFYAVVLLFGNSRDFIPTESILDSKVATRLQLINETEDYDESDVTKCIPQYDFYQEFFLNNRANRLFDKTPLLLLAAYKYIDHIDVSIQSDGWYGQSVYCRYLDSDFKEIGEPLATKVFPEWSVSCCLRSKSKYMSITKNKQDPIVQYTKILNRMPNGYKYELSLCLAPMYGEESKWLLLAETIEHYKLQGVEHFYLYIKDMDEYSRRLVDSYVVSGDAEAIVFEHRQDRTGREWQLLGVQDCLLRSRYESRHSIFADIDERITPSKNDNLLQMTKKIFADEKVGLAQFRPRWIFRYQAVPKVYEGESTLNKHLPTLVYHNTTHWPGPGHTSKCILDPLKIFIMWVHGPMASYPGYTQFDVDPHDAVIRHYRDIDAGDWKKHWMKGTLEFGSWTETHYPEKIMPILLKNIKNRLDYTYNKEIPLGA